MNRRRPAHPSHQSLRQRKNERRESMLKAGRHCRTGGHHAPGELLRINPPDIHIPRYLGLRTVGPSNPRKAYSEPAPRVVVVVNPRPTTYTVRYVGPVDRTEGRFGTITVADLIVSKHLPPTTQVFSFPTSQRAQMFAAGIEGGGTPASWETPLERQERLYVNEQVVALT